MMQKFLATVISISLVATTSLLEVSIPKVFADYSVGSSVIYKDQCETYKSKNNDRTKVSNYPVKHYIDTYGLDATQSVYLMQTMKADKYCMQRADLEYSLKYIRDTAQREQVQAQIASVAQQENLAKESLRELEERQARIDEFLASLQALTKDGNSAINKSLIDEKQGVLHDFQEEFETQTKELKAQKIQKAKEVKSFFDDFSQASASEQQKMKETLESAFKNQYTQLKQELVDQRKNLESTILNGLKASLNQEYQEYENAVRREFSDNGELQGALTAFKALQTEKQERFEVLIKHILDAATVQIDSIGNRIERKIGDIDLEARKESFLVQNSMFVAFTSELESLIKQSDAQPLKEVETSLEKVEELKPLLREVNILLHSADFSLLEILDDEIKTQQVIQAIENDDHTNTALIGILDKITDEQIEEINQAFKQQEQQVEQMKESQEIVERIPVNEEEKFAEIAAESLNMCSKNKYLTQLSCDSIGNIVREYGAYGGFLIHYFSGNKEEQKSIQVFENKAIEAYKDVKKYFSMYSDISDAKKNQLKFDLLLSVLKDDGSVKYVSSEKKYKIQTKFSSKIKLAEDREKQLKIAFSAEVSQGTCARNGITVAIEQALGASIQGSCGTQVSGNKKGFQKRLNALRKQKGKSEFVFNGTVGSQSAAVEKIIAGGDLYEYYEQEKAVVQRDQIEGNFKSLVYFDDNERAKIKVDPVYVTFYKYDSYGRLVQKVKSVPSTSFVSGAWKIPAKWDSKVEWDYVGSSENIKERREYGLGVSLPTKTISYNFSSSQLQKIQVKNSKKSIVAEVIWNYNSKGNLLFLQEEKQGKKRYILASGADLEELFYLYPEIQKNMNLQSVDVVDMTEEFNPIYFIDADGTVLSQKVNLFAFNKNKIVSEKVLSVSNTNAFDPTCNYIRSCLDSTIVPLISFDTKKTSANYSTLSGIQPIIGYMSYVPKWNGLKDMFNNKEEYKKCLTAFLKNSSGNREVNFSLDYILSHYSVSKEKMNNFVKEVNDGKVSCSSVGMPIMDPIAKTFGDVSHVFWPMSNGAKFYSEGKYNFWISSDSVQEQMKKKNQGLEKSKFKTSLRLGTYIWTHNSGLLGVKSSTYYFVPETNFFSNVFKVDEEFLEELVEGHYRPQTYFCQSGSNTCPRNQVVELLGWPVEDQQTICRGGGAQKFINGAIYEDNVWLFQPKYVEGEIYKYFEEHGGACGEIGYPVRRPSYYKGGQEYLVQNFSEGKHLRYDVKKYSIVEDKPYSCFYDDNRNMQRESFDYYVAFILGAKDKLGADLYSLLGFFPSLSQVETWKAFGQMIASPIETFGSMASSISDGMGDYAEEYFGGTCAGREAYLGGYALAVVVEVVTVVKAAVSAVTKLPKAIRKAIDGIKNSGKIVADAARLTREIAKGISEVLENIKSTKIKNVIEVYLKIPEVSDFWDSMAVGSKTQFKKFIDVVNKINKYRSDLKNADLVSRETRGYIGYLKNVKNLPDDLKNGLFKSTKVLSYDEYKRVVKNNKNRRVWSDDIFEVRKALEERGKLLKLELAEKLVDKEKIFINIKKKDSINRKIEDKNISIKEMDDLFRGTIVGDSLEEVGELIMKFDDLVKNSSGRFKVLSFENKPLDSLVKGKDGSFTKIEAWVYKMEVDGEIFELQFKTKVDKYLGEVQHDFIDADRVMDRFDEGQYVKKLNDGTNQLTEEGLAVQHELNTLYQKGKLSDWSDLWKKYKQSAKTIPDSIETGIVQKVKNIVNNNMPFKVVEDAKGLSVLVPDIKQFASVIIAEKAASVGLTVQKYTKNLIDELLLEGSEKFYDDYGALVLLDIAKKSGKTMDELGVEVLTHATSPYALESILKTGYIVHGFDKASQMRVYTLLGEVENVDGLLKFFSGGSWMDWSQSLFIAVPKSMVKVESVKAPVNKFIKAPLITTQGTGLRVVNGGIKLTPTELRFKDGYVKLNNHVQDLFKSSLRLTYGEGMAIIGLSGLSIFGVILYLEGFELEYFLDQLLD